MVGPCLCGDPACHSCGPAQGYDLAREAFYDSLCEKFSFLVDLLDEYPQLEQVIDEVYKRAFDEGVVETRLNDAYRREVDDEVRSARREPIIKV